MGQYFLEVWRAAGMKLHNVKFLWASDEINKRYSAVNNQQERRILDDSHGYRHEKQLAQDKKMLHDYGQKGRRRLNGSFANVLPLYAVHRHFFPQSRHLPAWNRLKES